MALPNSETNSENIPEMMENYPTETYKINFQTQQVEGKVSGIEALKQAFLLAINTQRFSNEAFTSNYGMDWVDLIGLPDDYIVSEVLTRIQDMILADKRFLSVNFYDNNAFEIIGNQIIINLIVKTEEGDFDATVNITK